MAHHNHYHEPFSQTCHTFSTLALAVNSLDSEQLYSYRGSISHYMDFILGSLQGKA